MGNKLFGAEKVSTNHCLSHHPPKTSIKTDDLAATSGICELVGKDSQCISSFGADIELCLKYQRVSTLVNFAGPYVT